MSTESCFPLAQGNNRKINTDKGRLIINTTKPGGVPRKQENMGMGKYGLK